MKKYLIPGLVIVSGVLCVVSHLPAENCGELDYIAPAKCTPAKAVSPSLDSGNCSRGIDNVCGSSDCGKTAWGTALPGSCESVAILEPQIPKCETGGSTIVEIIKWQSRCYSEEICWCLWDETSEIERVEKCTCSDLPN